jgi:ADP-ribose pyrophosphatase YjhB (NUDIX family)
MVRRLTVREKKKIGCQKIQCPKCQTEIEVKRNPLTAVDIIIEIDSKGIILIKRKNPPFGWAIPGGFVEYGESLEEAAVREAKEETSLDVKLVEQFHTYSDPRRDQRFHCISTVYTAKSKGTPEAKDDAAEIGIFNQKNLPDELAFDHQIILRDYFKFKSQSSAQRRRGR